MTAQASALGWPAVVPASGVLDPVVLDSWLGWCLATRTRPRPTGRDVLADLMGELAA